MTTTTPPPCTQAVATSDCTTSYAKKGEEEEIAVVSACLIHFRSSLTSGQLPPPYMASLLFEWRKAGEFCNRRRRWRHHYRHHWSAVHAAAADAAAARSSPFPVHRPFKSLVVASAAAPRLRHWRWSAHMRASLAASHGRRRRRRAIDIGGQARGKAAAAAAAAKENGKSCRVTARDFDTPATDELAHTHTRIHTEGAPPPLPPRPVSGLGGR